MTKRRWLVLPAAAAILFAACSGGGASTAPSSAATDAPATDAPATVAPASSAPAESIAPESIKIGFVTHVLGNPFIQQIIDGANAAAKDLNVELQVTGPEGGDADAQLKAVQTLVASGVQGIAIHRQRQPPPRHPAPPRHHHRRSHARPSHPAPPPPGHPRRPRFARRPP